MSRERSTDLDMVRGLAALAVVISHLRAFLLLDYHAISQRTIAVKIVYFVTGFGHEAVIVFFVLSGYLISGTIISRAANWSWTDYALNRLSRLWVVLLPALAATFVWNMIGIITTDTGYYHGQLLPVLHSGPSAGGVSLNYETLFGNVFFLQTIITPCFGDNGPLWSLANEFWYYALFPLLFFACGPGGLLRRAFYATLAGAIAVLLPWGILSGFATWCVGFLLVLINPNPRIKGIASRAAFLPAAGAAFGSSLVGVRTGIVSTGLGEMVVGLTFGAVLLGLINRRQSAGWLISRGLAWVGRFSYTLYLTHFSFIALTCGVLFQHRQFSLGFASTIYFTGILAVTVAYAFLCFQVFERNTGKVRFLAANLLTPLVGARGCRSSETTSLKQQMSVAPEGKSETAANATTMPLVVWMNQPSPYQTEFFAELARTEGVALTVVYAQGVSQDRRNLGWRAHDDAGFATHFISGSAWVGQALCLAWRNRRATHLINGVWSEPRFVAVALVLALCGRRFYFHSEAVNTSSERRGLVRFVKHHFARAITRFSEGIFVIGGLAQRYYAAIGIPENKLIKFSYFRDLPAVGRQGEPVARSGGVTYLGQFVPRKRVEDLISAIARLKREGEPVQVTISGAGPLTDDYKRLVRKLDVGELVTVTGPVQAVEVPAMLGTTSVLCLLSDYDGWGIVVNEALACGCPVVVTETCGAAELVKASPHYGIVVPCGHPEKVADALRQVLANRERYTPDTAEVNARIGAKVMTSYFLRRLIADRTGQAEKPNLAW